MADRRRMIDTSISEEEEGEYPSRGDKRVVRRREQNRLEALGLRLTTLDARTLESLELGDTTEQAVRHLATLSHGSALPRQRRRVATLLRVYDLDEIEARVETAIGAIQPSHASTHRLERLRGELLDPDKDALTRILDERHDLDRPRLQQAVRAARGEAKKGTRGRRYKELYQVLKEMGFGASGE